MALKDGRCIDCKIELPMDFGEELNQLLGGFTNGMARGKGTSSKGNSN
jgi:hypothetical protein